MADYRQIHTKIWTDEWFLDQESDGKLLFVYLFSNSRSCLAGIYDIPLKVIAFETGLAVDRIRELLATFGAAGKVMYQDGYVWLPKMMVYNAQNLTNPKIVAHINQTIDALPDIPLRHQWIEYCRDRIGYQYGMDTPAHEQEQEQPTEQEQEQELPVDGAVAPPTAVGPLPALSFQGFLDELKAPGANMAAVAVHMATQLYPGHDPPDYGRMGKAAKRLGSWSMLAKALWDESTRPPVGNPLDYIERKHKAGGYRGNGNGRSPGQGSRNLTDAESAALTAAMEEAVNR